MLDERPSPRHFGLALAALILLVIATAIAAIAVHAVAFDRPASYVGFLPASQSPTPDAQWARDYAKIEIRDNKWRPLRVRLELRASPEAPPQGALVTFLVNDRPLLEQLRVSADWTPLTLTIDPPRPQTPGAMSTPSIALQIKSDVFGTHGTGVGLRGLHVSPVIASADGVRTAAVGACLGALIWLLLPPTGAAARRSLSRALEAIARPIVAVPGLALCLFIGAFLIWDDVQWWPAFSPIDLPSFYWAARVAFVDGQSPYTTEALARGATLLGQHVWPFLSPPPSLLLFAPLASLRFDTAAIAVARLNSALFIAGLVLIFRYLLRVPLATPLAIVMLVYALSFWPVHSTIVHGQVNLLVMVCLVIAWWRTRDAGARGAALPIAAAIGFKTYPALVLPLLVLSRRSRALVWTLGLIVVLALIAVIALPRAAWTDWLTHVAPTLGYGLAPWQLFEAARVYNQSLNGLVARIFGPSTVIDVPWPWPGAAGVVTYVLAALTTAWHFRVCWETRDRDGAVDAHWAATLFLMFMLAPFSWEHHLVMVLPAGLFVMQHAWRDANVPLWTRLVAAIALILIAWPLAPESPEYREGWRTLLISTKGICVIALWAVTLSWLRRV